MKFRVTMRKVYDTGLTDQCAHTYEANSPVEAKEMAEAAFPTFTFVRTRPVFSEQEKLDMGWYDRKLTCFDEEEQDVDE